MSKKVTKSEIPRQARAKIKNSAYTIRIISEPWREYRLGNNAWYEIVKTEVPTPSNAWAIPSTFEVVGLTHRYEFVVDRVKVTNKTSRFAITEFRIFPNKEGEAVENLGRLPLEHFLKRAVELAALQCVAYPSGYEGIVYTSANLQNSLGTSAILKVGKKEFYAEPIGWRSQVSKEQVIEMLGDVYKPRKNAVDDKRLREVAKVYASTTHGSKVEAVAEFIGQSKANAKKLISKAREAGFIPPATKKGGAK